MSDERPTPPRPPASEGAALQQAGASPLGFRDPGRIGPYIPLGLLGSGGMGHVYLARPSDGSTGLAAVKVIRPEYAEDARFRRRFEREAAVHSRVHTPRTPQLLGTGFHDSLLWMGTQYLPGLNLAEAVRECGRLERAGVWRLIAELGQALAALAAADVVHRDLKPSNVVLSLQGVYVIDFGIAQAADGSAITSTGSRVGTPAFMAPEYLREGHCDTASDVFSLAGSLIYAATGHAPFGDGTGVDVMHRVAFEEPKQDIMAELSAVDPALAALMAACLAKDPAARPLPRQLIEAATSAGHTHGTPPAWHEPLRARLLARQQACEVLERVAVEETVQLRTPVAPPMFPGSASGAGPVFGQPTAPTSPTPHTVPAAHAVPAAHTSPTPAWQHAAPDQTPAPGGGGPRRKRKVLLAVAASLAVCAVAAGAFLLTRPPMDETASAAPTATDSTAPGGAQALAPPGVSASPSGKKKESEKAEPRESESGASESATAAAGEGGTRPTPGDKPSATSGNGGSTPAGTPTPTAPTTPATPPWISQCTYYSGTELTVRGNRGQRVVQVQCMLTKRGYSVGSSGVDGEFGDATLAAVKQFQGAKGLEVDGEVGPNTWAALRSST
ncbi:protein kinase [Streptomyces sp. PAN_FS17]|uniref:protein kinase domain-containing protein n=1 Tax=Streptomyces sp. PAN_FS17 TaxID=1855351 RepID=UPI000899635E|nr:protein kinase [Streptomyces sp. PAN_FS17]SED05256.1 Serine/threonine protein kinase [Streptomyces sp. PAN_FS17]